LSNGYKSRLAAGGGIFTEVGLNKLFSIRFGIEYIGMGGKREGIQAMSSNQLISGMATSMASVIEEHPELIETLMQMAGRIPRIFYADVRNTAKFDYLMLPVSLQIGKPLSEKWSVYFNGGPFLSFLMSGEQISRGSSKLYLDDSKTTTIWSETPDEVKAVLNSAVPELAQTLENGAEFGDNVITGDLRPVNVGVQANLGVAYQCNKNRFFAELGGNYGFIRLQKDSGNGTNYIGTGTLMFGFARILKN
jgi:hypothetical protein